MSDLALFLFGAPRIEREGAPVEVGRRKALALLAYLAATRQSHTRETLAALLWPEHEPASARGEVRRALSAIRKMLGDGWLDADREIVRLNDGLWLDVAQFQHLLKACQQHGHPPTEVCLACRDPLTEAAALAQDEFMAGFTLPDSPAFDDWQSYEREGLRRDLAGALERLARLLGRSAEESTEQAIGYARRWLALDPLDEAAHRLLMQLYARSGQRQAALQQYQECVQLLESELGLPPTDETTALVERIRSGELAEESTAQPPPVLTAPPTHNLPALTTPFIGREDELEEVEALLGDPESRLLTVIGPGGMGKTRIALESAHRAAERGRFTNGVYFAGLAPVSSPTFLASSIAASLSLQLQGSSDPQAQLLQFLRGKEMLLVLDNFEHLLEGATLLSDILQSAPHVTLLVTSRERLALRAETILPLEGLPFPSGEAVERAEEFSAVQLFVESAQRVERGFKLTEERRAWVVRICQLVQGLPLAIELAAAWVRALSCEEIAREIEQDLDFLSGTMRDLPERHRSLRAVFEHSWRLLSEEERRVFRRLAVFRGGFLWEAAEQVAGATRPILSTLVDKSLLSRDGKRYGRHTLLWQFASEKLRQFPDEEARVRDTHSEYYATFLARREARLLGGGQKEALEQVGAELENVRVAWQWMLERGRISALERSVKGLSHFYIFKGLLQEGEAVFGMAAEQMCASVQEWNGPREVLQSVIGRLLAEQARFLNERGDYARAVAAAEAALSQARAAEDGGTEAIANLQRGHALWRQTDYAAAQVVLEQSLAQVRALPAPRQLAEIEAESLRHLGIITWYQGNYGEAREYYEQSLRLFRKIGDYFGESGTLRNRGNVAWSEGNYAEARDYYERSLRLCREIGDQLGESRALGNLGIVSLPQGNYGEALDYFKQSLHVFRQMGNRLDESKALAHLGDAALYLGNYADARRYYEQSVHLCRQMGDQQGECGRLSSLGLVVYLMGDDEAALDYSQIALRLAQEISDPNIQGEAFTNIGHALTRLGRLEAAGGAYSQALALRRKVGEENQAMEAVAGLARLFLTQGKLKEAQAEVESILAHLEHGTLDGTNERFQVYLTSYRVLHANQDPRAPVVLDSGYALLQERAAKITDPALRRLFLENVAAHREIMAEWQARQG